MHLEDIETIGVIGAGRVGRRLAVEFLRAGYRVFIYNRRPETSRAAAQAIQEALREPDRTGVLRAEAASGRLIASLDVVQAGGNAEFVVEAVPDDLELKREMYRRIEEVGEPDAIIASVSRVFSADALAAGLEHPDRLLVIRDWGADEEGAPIRVQTSLRTGPEVASAALALLRRLGKRPELA